MARPLVSIIIPVYNGEQYLAEAIDSVLAQTFRPIEILVVDDGSTDKSANIAKSFKEIRYYHQTNQGVSVARNIGLANARGKFVAFIDADDIWTPNKLDTQINYFLKHPHVCYSITNQRFIIELGTIVPAFFNKELLQKDHPAFVPSSLVARKVVFEQIGGFDTTYVNFGEDIEWFTRAKDAGMPMVIHKETLLHRRMHKSNISMHRRMNYPQLLKTLKKTIDCQTNQRSVKKLSTIMGNSRLISIIIPAYNRECYLAEAIESVIAQTYRPIEIIVVDDGSTDGTADVAKRFFETIRYFYQSNSGCSAARNKGIENALGSFFSFLDSDDLWVEEKLSRQMAVLESDPEVDMVFGQVSHFYSHDLEQNKRAKKLNSTGIMPGYHAGTLLIKRDAFLRVGLFDIKYEWGEFLDWYGKAKETGLKNAILPEVVMKRRIHSSNSVLNRNAQKGYIQVLKASLDRKRKNDSQI